jgi:ethanolamine ammonia-lyase small subunit
METLIHEDVIKERQPMETLTNEDVVKKRQTPVFSILSDEDARRDYVTQLRMTRYLKSKQVSHIRRQVLEEETCKHLFSMGFQVLNIDTMSKKILSHIVHQTCTSHMLDISTK